MEIKKLPSYEIDWLLKKNESELRNLVDDVISFEDLLQFMQEYNVKDLNEALRMYIYESLKQYASIDEQEQVTSRLLSNTMYVDLIVIPNDDLKLKYLKRIKVEDENILANIVASLSSDDIKKQYLKSFSHDVSKATIIASLSNDEDKLKLMHKITDRYKRTQVIESLESDEEKKRLILSGEVHHSKISEVLSSMQSDEIKLELLPLVGSDIGKAKVIASLANHEIKKDLFNSSLRMDLAKEKLYPIIISSLPKEEQFKSFDEYDDRTKSIILQKWDLLTQLKYINSIKDEKYKRDVLNDLSIPVLKGYVYSEYLGEQVYKPKKKYELVEDDFYNIVKYSSISDCEKIRLIKGNITDINKIRELLNGMDVHTVVQEYFGISDKYIDIEYFDEIAEVYNIYAQKGVSVKISQFFDFDNPENMNKLKNIFKMEDVSIIFPELAYSNYEKIADMLENVEKKRGYILLIDKDDIPLETLEVLCEKFEFCKRNGAICETERYIFAERTVKEYFDVVSDERIRKCKDVLICSIIRNDNRGYLEEINKLFDDIGLNEEEKKEFGKAFLEKLFEVTESSMYDVLPTFDDELINIIDEWDCINLLVEKDCIDASYFSSTSAMLKAVDLAVKNDAIDEETGIQQILNVCVGRSKVDEGTIYATKIILELLEKQNLSVRDINMGESGAFSDVFMIGDFVIKVGGTRQTVDVPSHDRVLDPVLKVKISTPKSADPFKCNDTIIEVQPRLEKVMDKEAEIPAEKADEELYSIYRELRESGIVWTDIAKRNVGFYDASKSKEIVGLFDELKVDLNSNPNVTLYGSQIPAMQSHETSRWIILDADFLYRCDQMTEILKRDENGVRFQTESQILYTPSNKAAPFEERYFEATREKREEVRRMKVIEEAKKREKDRKRNIDTGWEN